MIDLFSLLQRDVPRRGRRLAILLSAATLLASCQGVDNPGMNAILVTGKRAIPFINDPVEAAQLDPKLGYLRVTYDGNVALFALGFIDRDQFGYITVYYGPERSMLKLQNGHLLALQGTSLEWHAVKLSENPGFPAASGRDIERRRDVQPGDRFDRVDHLVIQPAEPNARELQGIDPKILSWYVEQSGDLPAARVATNSVGTPIYGEQVLDDDHVLTWQLWPVDRIHPLP